MAPIVIALALGVWLPLHQGASAGAVAGVGIGAAVVGFAATFAPPRFRLLVVWAVLVAGVLALLPVDAHLAEAWFGCCAVGVLVSPQAPLTGGPTRHNPAS